MFRPPNKKIVFVMPVIHDSLDTADSPVLASAEQLAAAGAKVELWATTAGHTPQGIDTTRFHAGEQTLRGMPLRRFSCRPRNETVHESLRYRLSRGETLSDSEEALFFRNGIGSNEMREAIVEAKPEALFVFNPCVASTTILGVTAAPMQSIMAPDLGQPLLRRLRKIREAVALCPHFLFHSEPERLMACRILELQAKHQIAASGIEGAEEIAPIPKVGAEEERLLSPVPEPFLLASPVTEQALARLCEFAAQLNSDSPLPWIIVLMSSPPFPVPSRYRDVVRSLVEVDASLRAAVFSQASAYVHVSAGERVSPVMLQAWLHRCPVLAFSGSHIASTYVRLAQGGLCFDTYEEFRHAAMGLAREPRLRRSLGDNGRRYVRRNFRWSIARERQMRFFREIEQGLVEVEV